MLATCLCPQPEQSVHATPFYFIKISFHIILPFMSRSSKWSLSFRFKPSLHFSFPLNMSHSMVISSSLIWQPKYHLVESTNHKSHYYVALYQVSWHFFLLKPKNLPQHPVLKRQQQFYCLMKHNKHSSDHAETSDLGLFIIQYQIQTVTFKTADSSDCIKHKG